MIFPKYLILFLNKLIFNYFDKYEWSFNVTFLFFCIVYNFFRKNLSFMGEKGKEKY